MKKLTEEYNLCYNNNHYLYDGDLEELFDDSNITVGEVVNKALDWEYDDDCFLVGCSEGDYLETVELFQNGKKYICQAFAEDCGCGIDYMLALNNVRKVKE